jgi:hypothetical protein
MPARTLYLLLCIPGALVPLLPFAQWLQAQSFDSGLPGRFFAELFSTRIGAFFGLDVILSALTLFVFIAVERRTKHGLRVWPSILGTLVIGVSLGLPLYLYERERASRPKLWRRS